MHKSYPTFNATRHWHILLYFSRNFKWIGTHLNALLHRVLSTLVKQVCQVAESVFLKLNIQRKKATATEISAHLKNYETLKHSTAEDGDFEVADAGFIFSVTKVRKIRLIGKQKQIVVCRWERSQAVSTCIAYDIFF